MMGRAMPAPSPPSRRQGMGRDGPFSSGSGDIRAAVISPRGAFYQGPSPRTGVIRIAAFPHGGMAGGHPRRDRGACERKRCIPVDRPPAASVMQRPSRGYYKMREAGRTGMRMCVSLPESCQVMAVKSCSVDLAAGTRMDRRGYKRLV
ncbi:hypothetical protein GXY_13818 [Novacetimonas hansenii ATCC 23769]|uniref:Uncharacterized protein n=1 Tax=Novacetimonas hansenii ATCC 23769 TaxID=714995 RepID=D5QHY5_NOVHA|nr:hypothetical protein GXY_13818 [Novacetimonas hansenii ATCC 23769]